jgi:hypothetical protein
MDLSLLVITLLCILSITLGNLQEGKRQSRELELSFNSTNDLNYTSSNSVKSENSVQETIEKPLFEVVPEIDCTLYTDCYNCSIKKQCEWYSTKECGKICRTSTEERKWYKKLTRCIPEENIAMQEICPKQSDEIDNPYKQVISLPPEGHTMPINGFCFWQINNYNEQEVDIKVTNYEVVFTVRIERRQILYNNRFRN